MSCSNRSSSGLEAAAVAAAAQPPLPQRPSLTSPQGLSPVSSDAEPPHSPAAQGAGGATPLSKRVQLQRPTALPALVLGDVFAPCSALRLFKSHGDLDQLFGRLGSTSSSGAAAASRSSTSTAQQQQQGGPLGLAGLPGLIASSFTEGLANLRRAYLAQQQQSQQPLPQQQVGNKDASIQQQQQHQQQQQQDGSAAKAARRSAGSRAAAPLSTEQKLAASIDPSVQLLVRTVCPVGQRRLFFVSPAAADTVREALVLDRHKLLQQRRAAQLSAAEPLAAAAMQGSAATSPAQQLATWWGGLAEWLKPLRLDAPPTATSAAANTHPSTPPRSAPTSAPADTPPAPATRSPAGSASNPSTPAASPSTGTASRLPNPLTPGAGTPPSSRDVPPRNPGGLDGGGGGAGPALSSAPGRASVLASGPMPAAPIEPMVRGPHQVIPMVAQLVDAATRLGPAFDWHALEERCVAAEASHIQAGGTGRPPTMREGPSSFVGRVPLHAALTLVCAAPDRFSCVSTGADVRIAREAHGKAAALDLQAMTETQCMLRVEEHSSDDESDSEDDEQDEQQRATPVAVRNTAGRWRSVPGPAAAAGTDGARRGRSEDPSTRLLKPQEAGQAVPGRAALASDSEEEDDDMALTSMTPVFQVPGLTLSLRNSSGQRMALTPTFLSINQMHAFMHASQAVCKAAWVGSRRAQRTALARKLEAAALALSGLVGPAGSDRTAAAAAAAAAAAQEAEDDDEDGLGEPPEAKALLAELGEGPAGRARAGAGLSGAAAGQGTLAGLPAVLSTLAVGVLSAVGHAAAAVGNAWDLALANSPWALPALGYPKQLAVCVHHLEPLMQQLAMDNAGRTEAWRAARSKKPYALGALGLPGDAGSATASNKQKQQQKQQQQQQVPAPYVPPNTPEASGSSGAAAPSSIVDSQAGNPSVGTGTASGSGSSGGTGASTCPAAQPLPDPQVPAAVTSPAVPSSGAPVPMPPVSQPAPGSSSTPSGGGKGAGTAGGRGRGASSTAGTGSKAMQLESLAGMSMMLQAGWAVLMEALEGEGRLAVALAAGWSGQQAKVMSDGELAIWMMVQLHASQPQHNKPSVSSTGGSSATSAVATSSSSQTSASASASRTAAADAAQGTAAGAAAGASSAPDQQPAPQPAGKVAGGPAGVLGLPGALGKRLLASMPVGMQGGQQQQPAQQVQPSLAALLALNVPPHLLAEPQRFEVGLLVNMKKLKGEVPPAYPDAVSEDPTCLRGLLLIGDLGLGYDGPDNGLGGPGMDNLASSALSMGPAPSIGFLDLAHLLAARQRQHGTPFLMAATSRAGRKAGGSVGGPDE